MVVAWMHDTAIAFSGGMHFKAATYPPASSLRSATKPEADFGPRTAQKSLLFIDQFREVTGGQIVRQGLVLATQEDGYRVGVLAPMGGGLERALKARCGNAVALHEPGNSAWC